MESSRDAEDLSEQNKVFKVIEEMQRDAIKPTFQQTRNRSSLLPSVVVLPKIGTGRNEEGTQKAMPRSENGNLHQLPPSGSLFNTNLITKTAHQSTSAVEDSLEDRSYTVLPPNPAKASVVEARKVEKKPKNEQGTERFKPSDKLVSMSMTYNNRGFGDRKHSGMVLENALVSRAKGLNGFGTYEDPAARDGLEDSAAKDLWYYGKQREPGLIRRESCCSSCGGALSYTNSFASTRRFSSVSIEVPNESFIRKSLINRNPSLTSGDSLKYGGSSLTKMKKGEARNLAKSRSDQRMISKSQYDRIEKQKNLLYDLVSVLYKKNFVKEEVRPYVQHALKICSNSNTPKNGKS